MYSRIFDLDGKNLTIGGIQTYLLNLAKLFKDNNYDIEIFQSGNFDWEKIYNGIKFIGIDTSKIKKTRDQRIYVYNKILEKYEKNDVLIFGTDSIAIKNKQVKSISIQHGIYFDYLNTKGLKLQFFHRLGLDKINMYLERRRAIKEFLNSDIKVCVDYNFLNSRVDSLLNPKPPAFTSEETKKSIRAFWEAFEASYTGDKTKTEETEENSAVAKFLHDLTTKGAAKFLADFNMEKIQAKIDEFRKKLEEQMGDSPEALQEIEKMVEEYTKQLLEELQNSLDSGKKEKPGTADAIIKSILKMKVDNPAKPLEELLSS